MQRNFAGIAQARHLAVADGSERSMRTAARELMR
jgi:hypothetical protein